MAKYIPSRNYIGSSEIATDLDVTGPATFANNITLTSSDTDTYIEKTDVADLYILNSGDDKDIILGSDDGSGNTTAYLTLDGSAAITEFYKNTKHGDSVKANFGGGNDLKIYHNGTNSYIDNANISDLYIRNTADGKDVIFQSDDGSGGVATYLTLDGSTTKTIFSKPIEVGVDDAGHDVKFFGDTSGKYMLWDASANQLRVEGGI